eukprot:CAMPEP_0119026582 /NCGR_PEP_ID=MMETSP1176-20130426/35727_1 /TAXON_ID=265551 /ORGANISM="Synedropsis recta cf, Strain CCMP1620" /LENGTH=230 /DNA_ID=CAMNT_0006982327 /DNA_START=165 /DNA_END=857 /DNA_ORIENTATION=-
MKALFLSKKTRPRFRQLGSFPPSVQQTDDEVEVDQSLTGIEERFGRSKIDDEMNSSMALNDLIDETQKCNDIDMPLKDIPEINSKKPLGRRRGSNPVRSILRNGSGRSMNSNTNTKPAPARSQSDKRLSFALSPTFISDKKIRCDFGQDSMISLDGDDIFPEEESHGSLLHTSSKGEGSLVLSSPPPGGNSRRNSLNQYKAKSSQGFDERFVGLSDESDMGSFNASWSSL